MLVPVGPEGRWTMYVRLCETERACEETQAASKGGRKISVPRYIRDGSLIAFCSRVENRKREGQRMLDREAADIRNWESREENLCLRASAMHVSGWFSSSAFR